MDLFEVSRREKRQTFFVALALAVTVSFLAVPVVEAAVTRVTGTVTAKVKDTSGGTVNSQAIPAQGLTDVPGSSGALDVRNFAGGAGLLGVADCGGPLPDAATVPGGSVVTNMLFTGTDGVVTITTDVGSLAGIPLLRARVNADNPNVVADLANGLGLTTNLIFTATGTDCQVVILGHGEL